MSRLSYHLKQVGNVTLVGTGESGGKGTNTCLAASQILEYRQRTGIRIARIPKTVVLTDSIASKVRDDEQGARTLIRALAESRRLVRENIAVRSSAICEDGAYSCPGLFGTELLAFEPSEGGGQADLGPPDITRILNAIARVNGSTDELRAREFVARRRLDARMAVMLQTLVGVTISNGRYFAPLFTGVVDTSGINGEGTTTVSMVLGLGNSAISSMHNSTTLIIGRSPKDIEVVSRQVKAEVLKTVNNAKNPTDSLSMTKMLKLFGFRNMAEAIDYFVVHYIGSLSTLVNVVDRDNPLDLEFAITPHEKRLYYIQSRRSHFVRTRNLDYPTEIPNQRTIASSSRVLGGNTVKTALLAVYHGGGAYDTDAQAHFKALKELDALGELYILIIPPNATSSACKNLPITTLTNLAFVVEDPDFGAIHERGATGADHFTRLFFDTGMSYMEAPVKQDVLSAHASQGATIQGQIATYRGSFVAAVCSSDVTGKKGVLFIE